MAVVVDLTSSPPTPTDAAAHAPHASRNKDDDDDGGEDGDETQAQAQAHASSKLPNGNNNSNHNQSQSNGNGNHVTEPPATPGAAQPAQAQRRSSRRLSARNNAATSASASGASASANASVNGNAGPTSPGAGSAKQSADSSSNGGSGSSSSRSDNTTKRSWWPKDAPPMREDLLPLLDGLFDSQTKSAKHAARPSSASTSPTSPVPPPSASTSTSTSATAFPTAPFPSTLFASVVPVPPTPTRLERLAEFRTISGRDASEASEADSAFDAAGGDVKIAMRLLLNPDALRDAKRALCRRLNSWCKEEDVDAAFEKAGGDVSGTAKVLSDPEALGEARRVYVEAQQQRVKEEEERVKEEKRVKERKEEAEQKEEDVVMAQPEPEPERKEGEKEKGGPLEMTKLQEELEKVEQTQTVDANKPAPIAKIDAMQVDDEGPPLLNGGATASSDDHKPKPPSRVPSPLTSPPLHAQGKGQGSPSPSPPQSKPQSKVKPGDSPSPPATSAATATAAAPTASQKPKSTKAANAKAESPEPAPAPVRAPLQTIRLEIALGGPGDYAVDVRARARETGQRAATPPPVKRDTSESEGEDGDDEPGAGANGKSESGGGEKLKKGKGKGKAGKRKNHAGEYYDLDDPFIDDSELALDERTFFAQTKQQGFYVSSGEVALLKDRSAPPPVSSRGRGAKPGSGAHGLGRGSTPPPGSAAEGGGGSPMKKPKSKKMIPVIIPLAGAQVVSDAAATIPLPSHHSQIQNPAGGNGNGSGSGSGSGAASPADPFGPSATQLARSPGTEELGTRDVPIALSDNESASVSASAAGTKRKAADAGVSVSAGASGKKKRKTVEIEMFHPDLQPDLHELQAARHRESFEERGKFPPSLKPLLARVALKAIACGEYGDAFFALMARIFPYNRFTMSKLIKRTVYADHQKVLAARQDELLEELAQEAKEGFEKAREEHERALKAWERRRAQGLGQAQGKSAEGTPAGTPGEGVVSLPPVVSAGVGSDGEGDALPGAKDGSGAGAAHVRGEAPPPTRYRLTDRLRNIIWELVVLSNESVRIENEKNTLENSAVQVSEQGTRKGLYQRIVAAFPEGWMTSGQISREVSVTKKRFEAQQAEEGAAS